MLDGHGRPLKVPSQTQRQDHIDITADDSPPPSAQPSLRLPRAQPIHIVAGSSSNSERTPSYVGSSHPPASARPTSYQAAPNNTGMSRANQSSTRPGETKITAQDPSTKNKPADVGGPKRLFAHAASDINPANNKPAPVLSRSVASPYGGDFAYSMDRPLTSIKAQISKVKIPRVAPGSKPSNFFGDGRRKKEDAESQRARTGLNVNSSNLSIRGTSQAKDNGKGKGKEFIDISDDDDPIQTSSDERKRAPSPNNRGKKTTSFVPNPNRSVDALSFTSVGGSVKEAVAVINSREGAVKKIVANSMKPKAPPRASAPPRATKPDYHGDGPIDDDYISPAQPASNRKSAAVKSEEFNPKVTGIYSAKTHPLRIEGDPGVTSPFFTRGSEHRLILNWGGKLGSHKMTIESRDAGGSALFELAFVPNDFGTVERGKDSRIIQFEILPNRFNAWDDIVKQTGFKLDKSKESPLFTICIKEGEQDLIKVGSAFNAFFESVHNNRVSTTNDYSVPTPTPTTRPKARRLSAVPAQTRGSTQRQSLAESIARDPVVYDPTPADSIVLVFPRTGLGTVSVTHGDTKRLDDGEFLNDTLIEYGLKMAFAALQAKDPDLASQVHIFNSFFYKKLSARKPAANDKFTDAYSTVRKWTSKFDLFSKRYVIVPINEHLHWYLAIIVNPGAVLQPSTVPPVVPRKSARKSTGMEASTNTEDVTSDAMDVDAEETLLPPGFDEAVGNSQAGHGDVTPIELQTNSIDVDEGRITLAEMPPPANSALVSYASSDSDSKMIEEELLPKSKTPPSLGATLITPSNRPPGSQARSPSATTPGKTSGWSASGKELDCEAVSQALATVVNESTLDPKKCYIYTFDSLGGVHAPVMKKLKDYLGKEAIDKKQMENHSAAAANAVVAKVPEQPNFCDCGLYLLHFVEEFLADPAGKQKFILDTSRSKAEVDEAWNMSIVLQKRGTMRDLIKKEKASYEEYRKPLEIQEAAEKAERRKKKEEQREVQEANQAALRAESMTREEQAKELAKIETARTEVEEVKMNGKGKGKAATSNTRKGRRKEPEVLTLADSDDEVFSSPKGSSPLQFEASATANAKSSPISKASPRYLEPNAEAGSSRGAIGRPASRIRETVDNSDIVPLKDSETTHAIEEFDDPPSINTSKPIISIRSKTPTLPPPPHPYRISRDAPAAPPVDNLRLPTLKVTQPLPQPHFPHQPHPQTTAQSSPYFPPTPVVEDSRSPPRPKKRPKHTQVPSATSESQHTRFQEKLESPPEMKRDEMITGANQDSDDELEIMELIPEPDFYGQGFGMPAENISVKGAAGSSSTNGRKAGNGNLRKSIGEA